MKSSILKMIKDMTQDFGSMELENYTAKYISEKLNISRNMVSQYLNEFVNTKELIKVNTRPVYFFDKQILTDNFNVCIKSNLFESIKALQAVLTKSENENKDFEKLIGYDNSLSYCVQQCKAAITYPPQGLPILLHGPTGSGKSLLAQLMYEYAVNKEIIAKGKLFITMNCSEYANNPELLTANLFGHTKGAFTGADKDRAGLLTIANGGVLFLDEVHCLNSECQEKLFLFMDKGIYHMVGDNEKWYEAQVKMIFATTENPEDVLLKTLLRRIPIVSHIPSLEERSLEEKKELIFTFIKEEAKKVGRKIFLSNKIFSAFLHFSFRENVGQLKNCIKNSCANAFLQISEATDTLEICVYHLPDYILANLTNKNISSHDFYDEKMIFTADMKKAEVPGRLVKLCEAIIETYEKHVDGSFGFDEFLNTSYTAINAYYDYMIFEKKITNNAKAEAINKVMDTIFKTVINKYGFQIHNNDIFAFSRYLFDYIQNYSLLKSWKLVNEHKVEACLEFLKSNLQNEYLISMELSELINYNLDIQLNEISIAILIVNLKSYDREIDVNKIFGIILSHGYSTASSIADAANKFIGQYVFEAIDMPLEVKTEAIILRVKKYLQRIKSYRDIILLVDMGSLEDIYKHLAVMPNVNIGIINNITTRLAVDIGFKMIEEKSVFEILDSSSKNNYSTYKIIQNRHKDDTILFICETGIGTAKKIAELFKQSLPKSIDINFVSYDYQHLKSFGHMDDIFSKYNVVFIVGTIDPKIGEIPFISLEDIIIAQDYNTFNKLFHDYLSTDEIEMLNQNFLKIFSLQNLLKHLTILDADKVLDHVEDAVEKLQYLLGIKLNNKTIVGLYLHISCLIERLIKKNPIDTYLCMERFLVEQKQFIQFVKESFSAVEEFYNIEIPVTEIGYIYDYISNNVE